MKKKVIAMLLCAVMTVGMLTGCGKAGSEAAGGESAAEESGGTGSAGAKEMAVEGDDVTELQVWTFIELHQDFYMDMAQKWNEENPDKKVNLVLSNM